MKQTTEEINEFYSFLKGNFYPDDFIKKNNPRLSKKIAYEIIYIMQEYFKFIPSNLELCDNCDTFFDTNSDGHHCDCEDCENEQCKELYPNANLKKIKRALKYKFFCCQECEVEFLRRKEII